MVKARVAPGVQLVVRKSKRPCGKPIEPGGALGGMGMAPGGEPMNCGPEKEQVGPPPMKDAVMLPVPVPDGAVNVVTIAPAPVYVTELSLLVEARLALPARSVTPAAGRLATMLPLPVMPDTDKL